MSKVQFLVNIELCDDLIEKGIGQVVRLVLRSDLHGILVSMSHDLLEKRPIDIVELGMRGEVVPETVEDHLALLALVCSNTLFAAKVPECL